jgi:hypothetical protein
MWSILAGIHEVPLHSHPERTHHYQEFQDELNFDGIEFPVTTDKIGKFERQNNISSECIWFRRCALSHLYHKGTFWHPCELVTIL